MTFLKKIVRSVFYLLLISVGFSHIGFAQPFPAGHACAGTTIPLKVLNFGGGMQADGSDGLEFIVNNKGQIQINGYNKKGQIYSSGSCVTSYGASLYVNNGGVITLTQPANMIPISQSNVTGTGTNIDPFQVTTTFTSSVGGPEITRIDTYVKPQKFIGTQFKLANLNSAHTYKLFYHLDSYLAGGDSGNGYGAGTLSNGAPAMVGVSKSVSGSIALMGFRANSLGIPWDGYYSGNWSTLNSQVRNTPYQLSNTIDTAYQDNGFGVQWTVQNKTVFDTGEISGSFSDSLINHVLAFDPNTAIRGDTVDLKVTIENIGTQDGSEAYDVTLALGLELDTTQAIVASSACTVIPTYAGAVITGNASIGMKIAFPAQTFTKGTNCELTMKVKVTNTFMGSTAAASTAGASAPLALTPFVNMSKTMNFSPTQAAIGDIVDLDITLSNSGYSNGTRSFSTKLIQYLEWDSSQPIGTSGDCTSTILSAAVTLVGSPANATGTTLTFPTQTFTAGKSCVVSIKVKVLSGFTGSSTGAATGGATARAPLGVRAFGESIPITSLWVLLVMAGSIIAMSHRVKHNE